MRFQKHLDASHVEIHDRERLIGRVPCVVDRTKRDSRSVNWTAKRGGLLFEESTLVDSSARDLVFDESTKLRRSFLYRTMTASG